MTIPATDVIYSPSGLAAVNRTVQARLGDQISVADYGATGDGITDDTAALQAAIDYAHSLSLGNISVPYDTIRKGGTTVHLPAGAYKTTATLVIKEGVVLQGAGRFSTIISSSYDGTIIRNQTPLYYDAYGMGIRDLCIQGDRSKTSQVGIALLRDWQGTYSNVSVVECGSHGWRLYQCISTIFTNIEALECGGRGIMLTDGINSWDDTSASNLPSNNLTFYDPHVYGCDGAGIYFGRIGSGIGVMGCQTFGGSVEYNYKSSTPGAGYNIEIIDTSSPVPNCFDKIWCEDNAVLSHVFVNLTDAQEVIKFVDFKHFGSGENAYPQKAAIVEKGILLLDTPIGSGSSYRTYLGSNAPFQLTKATARIFGVNIIGSTLVLSQPQIVDETGASEGLENNVRVNNFGNTWGGPHTAFTDFGVSGPHWQSTSQSFPYAEMSTFYRGMIFGGGLSAPDAGLYRSAPDVISPMDGDFINAGSAWNGTHLLMGGYHLWVDSANNLRIKSGSPGADTDGVVVGTQT